MTERAPWKDGIDNKGLWTTIQTDPSRLFDCQSTRDDGLWVKIVEARKLLIAKALEWRAAAIADGWSSQPTYGHEAEETAFTLAKSGFVVQGIARPATKDTVGSGEISCWGPDGLHIPAAETYDWTALQQALTTCQYCHKTDVKTERVGFAGRCCADCLPAMRAAIETSGWTN